MKNLCLLIFIASSICSCKPADPYHYEGSSYIEMKKDPCFGFCPVYSFRVDGKGNAIFTGERNVSKEGNWLRQLDAVETNQLFESFKNAGFWELENEYTSQVTDLPTTWVTFHLGEMSKTIKDYYGAPENLKVLEKLVESIAETNEGWKQSDSIEVPKE